MRSLAAVVSVLLCLVSAEAKDLKIRHVLTLTVFDTSHNKVFALDRVNTDSRFSSYATPKVGDLIDVSIKGNVIHCVVTSSSTTYLLDPGVDPTISVSVALTQTP